jgi:hypothetical protein
MDAGGRDGWDSGYGKSLAASSYGYLPRYLSAGIS